MRREAGFVICLLTLLVGAVYGGALLSAGGGRPVAPLDDAYIHFQYARQIARGHPWQYNDGDPPSTGATSPLYPFLLAAGQIVGFRDEQLIWFALLWGLVSLAFSAWLIQRVTRLLVQPLQQQAPLWTRWTPIGTAILFLSTGAVQWSYLSGMESGLFALLVLTAFHAFLGQREQRSHAFAAHPATWIALAALVRPEGLILAGGLWLIVLGQSWHQHRPRRAASSMRSFLQDMGPTSVAVLVGFAPLLLNTALTGSPIATGARAKSWLGNVPFRFFDILASIAGNIGRILEQMALGLLAPQPWYLSPGVLLLAGAGWVSLLRQRKMSVLTLSLGWFGLGVLASASLITATWQVGRYLVPFLALLVPVAALGFVALVGRLPQRWRAAVGGTFVACLLAASAISTLQARSLYQRAIHTVTKQHLAVADWVHDNLPQDARIGVHDTGAIRYVGQRPTYDLIGLTTRGAATAWRHGAGAVFEGMERSATPPDYFATYPDVFSIPYLAATDLMAVELFRTEVPDFAVASAGPVQAVYQTDWALLGSGDNVYQNNILRSTQELEMTDRLDLADLEDEAAHHLRFWEEAARPGFPTEVYQFRYRTDPSVEVMDGGRLVNGGLAFRVTAQPGQPLLLVARLHAQQRGAVRVTVDDQDLGLWRYPAIPGQWLETAFQIPAHAITRDKPEIRLQVETTNPSFRHFALYYLWAWQGEQLTVALNPVQPLSARLGDAVHLVGYDQPGRRTAYRPGDTVALVLYWRAAVKLDEDAKVFVHLYDQAGEVVAQVDRRPYYGTRPPYTWAPGEAIGDPYKLTLPPTLPDGRYALAIGMYDPATGDRLSVTVDAPHRLSDDRILLNTIDVVSGTE